MTLFKCVLFTGNEGSHQMRSSSIRQPEPTAIEVEAALVRHYLRSDVGGGAGPVVFLDATEAALCDALGAPNEATAIAWLGAACGGGDAVGEVLAYGWSSHWPDANVPGYFRYLVLTCAVVANAHEDSESQDFGHNLRRMLRTDRSLVARRALPGLWSRLVTWCKERHDAGDAIREVRLPKPGAGAHIGMSNAMAFPNWRAVKKLRSDLESFSGLSDAAKDPARAALKICPFIVEERGYRPEMIQAARSFRTLHDRGNSLLHLHRFWMVVCHAARNIQSRGRQESKAVCLELIDGAVVSDLRVHVAVIDRNGAEVATEWRPFSETPANLGARLENWGDRAADRWRKLVKLGAVPFVSERFGVWAGTTTEPDGQRSYRYLVHARRKHMLSAQWQRELSFVDGDWLHLGPVDGPRANAIHRALRIEAVEVHTRPLVFEGGVKTIEGWLGRASLLPVIRHVGSGSVDVRAGDAEATTTISLRDIGEGRLALESESAVGGLYRFRLRESGPEDDSLAIEVPMRFAVDAPLHADLPRIPRRTRTDTECVVEPFRDVDRTDVRPPSSIESGRRNFDARFDDFLELVYASGRSGWAEGDLVGAIRELCPGPSPWDVLRALHEAGWLERRLSEEWRAVWWKLLPPTVVPLLGGPHLAAALEGSAPAAVRRRFQNTATARGALVECRPGIGPYSPMSLLAHGVDPTDLANELGWGLSEPITGTVRRAPACWPPENVSKGGFSAHKVWDWGTGAFRPMHSASGDKRPLLTWLRRDQDRHDVFSVEGFGREFLTSSRTIAILEAYRRKGSPLFLRSREAWVRSAHEGHFPLPLARGLHRLGQVAPGPVLVDGRWRFAYPVHGSERTISMLGTTLFLDPDEIVTAPSRIRSPSRVGIARHRMGGWSRTFANR